MTKIFSTTLLALLLLIAGCDLGTDEDLDDDFGEVEATVNGQDWSALPRAALIFTGEAFSPQNDSLINMQFDEFEGRTYRRGALVLTFFYRGDGDYEIVRTEGAQIEGDPDDPSVLDTLQANVTFWDTNHDVLTARFSVDEDDPFRVVITSLDRSEGVIRGEFSGTVIFAEGAEDGAPVRNYPDTLRFTNGAFESAFDVLEAPQPSQMRNLQRDWRLSQSTPGL